MPDLRFWRWRMAEDDDLAREIETHLELATDEHLEAARAREQSLNAGIQSAAAQLRVVEAQLQSARAQVDQKKAGLAQAAASGRNREPEQAEQGTSLRRWSRRCR